MLILLIVATVGIAMIIYEYSRPGRNWPAVRGWWLRAALFNSFQVFSVWFAGVAWDSWLVRHRFFSSARLGTYGGASLGYFATTFVFYWWHRWRHASRSFGDGFIKFTIALNV